MNSSGCIILGLSLLSPCLKPLLAELALKSMVRCKQVKKKNLLTRQYEANLFGIKLLVNSIAFQEQDKVVAPADYVHSIEINCLIF
ncbi:hypothetical protein ABKW11_21245 [Enterobacter hormaechei]